MRAIPFLIGLIAWNMVMPGRILPIAISALLALSTWRPQSTLLTTTERKTVNLSAPGIFVILVVLTFLVPFLNDHVFGRLSIGPLAFALPLTAPLVYLTSRIGKRPAVWNVYTVTEGQHRTTALVVGITDSNPPLIQCLPLQFEPFAGRSIAVSAADLETPNWQSTAWVGLPNTVDAPPPTVELTAVELESRVGNVRRTDRDEIVRVLPTLMGSRYSRTAIGESALPKDVKPWQVWYCTVPFTDKDDFKERPVVILDRNPEAGLFTGLYVTSTDKDASPDYRRLSSAAWETAKSAAGSASWVRVNNTEHPADPVALPLQNSQLRKMIGEVAPTDRRKVIDGNPLFHNSQAARHV